MIPPFKKGMLSALFPAPMAMPAAAPIPPEIMARAARRREALKSFYAVTLSGFIKIFRCSAEKQGVGEIFLQMGHKQKAGYDQLHFTAFNPETGVVDTQTNEAFERFTMKLETILTPEDKIRITPSAAGTYEFFIEDREAFLDLMESFMNDRDIVCLDDVDGLNVTITEGANPLGPEKELMPYVVPIMYPSAAHAHAASLCLKNGGVVPVSINHMRALLEVAESMAVEPNPYSIYGDYLPN